MSEDDRQHWDKRYSSLSRYEGSSTTNESVRPPGAFADHTEELPTSGTALVLACGSGAGAVWLADRGMSVVGVDVSPVAVGLATELAAQAGVAKSCRFEAFDLDDGLPAGPPADLILCNMFYSQGLPEAIIKRLAPGGLVAMASLSEVGSKPGRFTITPGQLGRDFAGLEIIAAGEGSGRAWIMARRKDPDSNG